MHVTHLPWCDFAVWSPVQEPFIQRVRYDAGFMTTALGKARKFYFNKFLPSVLPIILVPPNVPGGIGHHFSCSPTNVEAAPKDASDKATIHSEFMSTSGSKDTVAVASNQISICTPMTISARPILSTQTTVACTPVVSYTPVSVPLSTPVSSTTVSTPVSSTTVSKPVSSTTGNKLVSLATVSTPASSTRVTITSTSVSRFSAQVPEKKRNATSKAQYTAASADLEVIGSQVCKTLQFNAVLKELNIKCHLINGDSSCLYHAVTHQAGFISKSSRGDVNISRQLRQLALNMMRKYPAICTEDGLTVAQWLQKKMTILQSSEWGGDLELRLLAIGIQ